MKTIEKIAKVIAAIILIPTVLLVAIILLVDVTDTDVREVLQRRQAETESTAEGAVTDTAGGLNAPETDGTGAESRSAEGENGGQPEEAANAENTSDTAAGGISEGSGESGQPDASGGEAANETINEQKYEQIKNNMTYRELVELIGSEGRLTAESQTQGVQTAMYEWTAEDGWGTVIIVLQDDKVINKSQTGIAADVQTAPITLAQYEQIEEGMTYDKVVEIIGGDGEAISESNAEEAVTVVYIWKGSDGISNATITFFNNAVFSKAQYGLQ